MIHFNKTLDNLKNSLLQFPGVGEKTAQRFALFLLNQEKEKSLALAEAIRISVELHQNCIRCNMLSDTELCAICADSHRDTTQLCVVENTYDVFLIENTGDYHGYYFVLGHLLSPMDGIGTKEIGLDKLLELVNSDLIEEVILALNPSTEGETTINLIASEAAKINKKITRLSTGLPFGGNIEYSSPNTLSSAIKRRYSI